jgi:hypothetical protein
LKNYTDTTRLAIIFEEGESAVTHFGLWKDIFTAYTAPGGGLHAASWAVLF